MAAKWTLDPHRWTPEQAAAVVTLLDMLSEVIWASFGERLFDHLPSPNTFRQNARQLRLSFFDVDDHDFPF